MFNVGSGGAVFSKSKQDAFRKHFPNVCITNSFGSSESGAMGMDSGGGKGEGLGWGPGKVIGSIEEGVQMAGRGLDIMARLGLCGLLCLDPGTLFLLKRRCSRFREERCFSTSGYRAATGKQPCSRNRSNERSIAIPPTCR